MTSPTIDSPISHLLTLPNELLLNLGEHLLPYSLYSLIRTSRRLAILLLPRLRTLACYDDFSITALFWAAASSNSILASQILTKTTAIFRILPAVHTPSAAITAQSSSLLLRPTHLATGEKGGELVETIKDVLGAGAGLILHYKCITYTSLFWAVVAGHKNLATLILTSDEELSNINTLNACGRSALHEAVYRGNYTMVKLILSNTTTCVDLPDAQGRAPLYWAVVERKDPGMTALLLEHGANTTSYTDPATGRKLLHFSVLHPGTSAMVSSLLAHGADPTSRTLMGQSALHLAAKLADATTVRVLLSNAKCAENINTRDMFGWSPLHLAAKAGSEEVVKVLLEKGAEANARDDYGATPLHRAVWAGRERVVGMLVEHGADPHMADLSGKTGLDLAMIRVGIREWGARGVVNRAWSEIANGGDIL